MVNKMKSLFSLASLALLATCAAAPVSADGLTQGLDDPEVMAPVRTLTGFYGGLTYSRNSSSTEGVRCFKLGQPKACDDPIFDYYPEYKEEEHYTIDGGSEDNFGAFVGYREDLGQWLVGGELNYSVDYQSVGAQLVLDGGQVLPFVEVGFGQTDLDSGAVYSVGADLLLGQRVFIGVKANTADFEVPSAQLRLGVRF